MSFSRVSAALAALGALLILAAAPAAGFDSSSRAAKSYLTAEEAAQFAKQVERELAKEGARVAIVFRTGRARDKLPEGISYTHGAFWVYRDIETEEGRKLTGYAVYNLYHGDGDSLPVDRSYLYQDWPFDFVSGTAVDDVAVIVPSPEMQRRMLGVIDSPTYLTLHNQSYSLISNPLEGKHQNCNAFMLDVLAAAAWETKSPQQIRANLRAHFKPTVVKAGVFARLFGPMADPRLKTDDQKGELVTTTYESMADFMKDNGLLKRSYVLERDKVIYEEPAKKG